MLCAIGVGCAAPVGAPDPAITDLGPSTAPAAPAAPAPFRPALTAQPAAAAACDGAPSGLVADAEAVGTMASLRLDDAHVAAAPAARAGLLPLEGRVEAFSRLYLRPGLAACASEATAAVAADAAPGRIGRLVREAARGLGAAVEVDARLESDFAVAEARLCAAAGGCRAPQGALDASMRALLTPVLGAMADVLEARAAWLEGDPRGAEWWTRHGGHLFLDGDERPNPSWAPDRAQLLRDRAALYAAAARLADALEGADWASVRGGEAAYARDTGAGALRILGAAPDVMPADAPPDLLRIDVGGDDVYLGPVGGNGPAGLSVAVDLAGDDVYAYAGAEDVRAAAALPDDGAGRQTVPGRTAEASRSDVGRQGAARFGVGVLFDLGGDDVYVTLRGGQGYAQQGVGVLYDADGADVYVAEAGAQGAAQMGIGLLVDVGGGADRYRALTQSQGFGATAGVGLLVDDGGDDDYRCEGAALRYPSPQRPSANASFCQGAGLGFRADTPELSLPGGLGALVDLAGHDAYAAEVFAQGAGYWLGAGVLFDRAGDDRYAHDWYAAGAGAHFAVGALVDLAGDDVAGEVGAGIEPPHMSQGAGHDFSVGVRLDLGGADRHHLPSSGGGAASCGSVGVFVDAAGDDLYTAEVPTALGLADHAGCQVQVPTRAVFADAGGRDAYPAAVIGAADDAAWGTRWGAHEMEYAGAVDGAGPVGLPRFEGDGAP